MISVETLRASLHVFNFTVFVSLVSSERETACFDVGGLKKIFKARAIHLLFEISRTRTDLSILWDISLGASYSRYYTKTNLQTYMNSLNSIISGAHRSEFSGLYAGEEKELDGKDTVDMNITIRLI